MANTKAEAAPGSRQIRRISTVNLILGAWLIIAPFLFAVSAPALWNDVIVGVLVLILAGVRVSKPSPATRSASWTNVALGAWLIIAPFVLAYTSAAATWNDVVVGVLIAALALWSGYSPTVNQPTR